ncbi:MAG: phenol hydroxylase subunit [Burkholderiales bacterium]|nr:phenol hydroxylase subunit [Burkholderiales bacterium]
MTETVDTSRRFVRVLETRPNGLVAFEFSIGWPELAVELMLPPAAFAEFCAVNRVIRLDTPPGPDPRPTGETGDTA